MKKLYTLTIASLLAAASWGQHAIYIEQSCASVDGTSTDVSGQVIYENNISPFVVVNQGDVPGPENESHTKFYYTNLSGATQVVAVRRLKINVPGQWEELLCWAPCDDNLFEGTCASGDIMVGNPWTSSTSTLSDGESFEIKPGVTVNEVEGGGRFRYYIVEGNTVIDSIDLHINATASIDEPEPEIGMTVFPNPANNLITINTVGISGNCTVRISDVLGKVVYADEAGPVKKIDTGDFKNGVYLVSVLEKGNVIQTRRVVVKH